MSLFYFSRLVITFANFFLHTKMKFLPTGSGSKRSPRRLWIRSILKCGFGNTDWHVRLGFQHAAQLGHILYTRTVHIMISLLIHGNTAIHLTPPPLILNTSTNTLGNSLGSNSKYIEIIHSNIHNHEPVGGQQSNPFHIPIPLHPQHFNQHLLGSNSKMS